MCYQWNWDFCILNTELSGIKMPQTRGFYHCFLKREILGEEMCGENSVAKTAQWALIIYWDYREVFWPMWAFFVRGADNFLHIFLGSGTKESEKMKKTT